MATDLAAGFAAGIALCVVGHPFDTTKVLMQLQPGTYPTMASALRGTLASHGPAGLYKGVGAPLVGNGLYNAVQFAVFARIKALATDGGKNVTLARIAAASAVTGLAVALVEGPQDLIKSQVQAQMVRPAAAGAGASALPLPPRYTGTLDCARTIVRERGLAGIFQGLTATLARNFVGVGAYFYVYEALRMRLASAQPGAPLSPVYIVFAGGCGGCVFPRSGGRGCGERVGGRAGWGWSEPWRRARGPRRAARRRLCLRFLRHRPSSSAQPRLLDALLPAGHHQVCHPDRRPQPGAAQVLGHGRRGDQALGRGRRQALHGRPRSLPPALLSR